LVRPADLYLTPEKWREKSAALSGADFEYLSLVREGKAAREGKTEAAFSFATNATIPRCSTGDDRRGSEDGCSGTQVILAVPNTEKLSAWPILFTRVQRFIPAWKPDPQRRKLCRRNLVFAGDVLTTTLLKAYLPDGFVLPEAHFAIFGARDLFDESDLVASRPQRQKSKVSAFLSDFPRLAGGRLRGSCGAWHRAISRMKEINQGNGAAEFMVLEYADAARL